MNKKTADLEIKKKYAVLTMKWCQENLGINKKKRNKIKISVRIRPKKEGNYVVYGHFRSDDNKIIVYGINEQTLYEIVSTVIHEYTHYLQSNKKYWEYFKTHYYSTHPYERQAKRNEVKYSSECLKDIKKLI
jgi:hypothetical protein